MPKLNGETFRRALPGQRGARGLQTKKAAMQGIAALGYCAGRRNQRILLNSDIDCICENSVCAACSAVLSSWYWLNASA